MAEGNESRRTFVKRAAYMTPIVLTLVAAPEFAKAGSVKDPWKQPDKVKPPQWPKNKRLIC